MSQFRSLLSRVGRAVLPSAFLARHREWRWFRGSYSSWRDAQSDSSGYAEEAILRRAASAARAVRAGEGKWERDGAVFQQKSVNVPLLKSLRDASIGGRLDVIDIGGAFGGVWWQHRDEFAEMRLAKWGVVEQPRFAAVGKTEFAAPPLEFFETLPAAIAAIKPHVALLSCVLPYIENPLAMIADVSEAGFGHVILDRTPIARDGKQRLVVQHVPPSLGGGSYPAWIFSGATYFTAALPQYELVAEWPGFDEVDRHVEYRGFHFRRRNRCVSTS